MRYRLILPIAALVAALVAVPAAQAKIRVGLSEQNPAMFDQSNWTQLKLKRVRYILPWDYSKHLGTHAEVTAFMNAARAKRQEVLVTFSALPRLLRQQQVLRSGRRARRRARRPTRPSVKAFRKEFPYARTFSPWNEVNHVSQPTYRKPKLAASYYKSLKSVCKGCTVMAADVLDSSDVKTYLRRFLRASKGKGRIWGLHNYKDVNRHQSKGVKNVLSVVKGKVWLTETGGIVKFKPSFKYNLKRAASATKYMFKLARRYKRMERIYVYRYFGEPRSARFDAGTGQSGRVGATRVQAVQEEHQGTAPLGTLRTAGGTR